MITLIDRADGTPLTTLSPEDFVILQDQLVLESEQDFDYYLNDGTLELLAGAGLSPAAITALSSRMRHRGMDVGWEHSSPESSAVYSGSVVDHDVQALGGIRVDLIAAGAILGWSYSRNDGTFAVTTGESSGDLFLRFSGRGDLVLRELPLTSPGDQGQFELQTLYGMVLTDTDKPLAGVNVLLADWKSAQDSDTSWSDLGGRRSWGDTDDEGRFSIPISVPEDCGPLEIQLELITVGGQTLETVIRTITPGEGFDLGVLRAPEPVVAVLDDGPVETFADGVPI